MRQYPGRRVATLAFLLLIAVYPGHGAAQSAPPVPANEDCLLCHGDAEAKREAGTSVFVDAATLGASVHGQLELKCVDCHADLASAEMPHAEKLQPAQCSACHDTGDYQKSIHGRAAAAGKARAPTCASCHGAHDILPSNAPESRTNHLNLLRTCGVCHGQAAEVRDGGPAGGNVLAQFEDSIHGRALLRSGLTVAPSCTSCHGAHDIASKNEAASKVHRLALADTCGKCHEGIKRQYVGGRHGGLVQNGDPRAPVCADCHSAHGIRRSDESGWRLEVINECGHCHSDKLETYRDTFHGQVTELGFARVATCADCHGAHEMMPASDPRSPVSQARIVQTCQKCHEGANANFAMYHPHADPHDREHHPPLYYTARFMEILLVGVFSFFGIHSGLWFTRSWKEVRARRARAASANTAPTDTGREGHDGPRA
jgi:nitrate/TMAO reductase-like tetraheme cytochrome c subunit